MPCPDCPAGADHRDWADLEEPVVGADHELRGDGVPSGQAARLVTYPFSSASDLAFASSSRLTLLAAPSSAITRFRMTGARPATVTQIATKPGFGSDHRYLAATVAIQT